MDALSPYIELCLRAHMKSLTHRFWFWAIVQACVVAAIFGWRFYAGTLDYLAHPTAGDLYAHTWSFQAIVFSMFAAPIFVGGMAILLSLESIVIGMISKRQVIGEKIEA